MMLRSIHLAKVFLRMFARDRQALFVNLFVPITVMTILVLLSQDRDPIEISVANQSGSEIAAEFVKSLDENPIFSVVEGEAEALKKQVLDGDATLVLVIPAQFDDPDNATELVVLSTQPR